MKYAHVYILIAAFIIFCSVVYFQEDTTIFTCTTFFDYEKQDKWEVFCEAIDSIQREHDSGTLNQISHWLVVNEYSTTPKKDWSKIIQERYPFIEFVQKDANEKGQAASMNIILNRIKPYRYWIHWEEAWFCSKPCLDRMLDVMRSTNITQLQITQLYDKTNWLDSDKHPRILKKTQQGTEYYVIQSSPDTRIYTKKSPKEMNKNFLSNWPLYSLLPSINRVSGYNNGEFSTDPTLWPVKFEWDYARRWLSANNTKAVLPDGPVKRDEAKHKSTYSNSK